MPHSFSDIVPSSKSFAEAFPLDRLEASSIRWSVLLGDRKSGKQTTGALWAISRALLAPQANGLILTNLVGETLKCLADICQNYQIPISPYRGESHSTAWAIAGQRRCLIGPHRATVHILPFGQTRSDLLHGVRLGWAWVHHIEYLTPEHFQVIDQRLKELAPGVPGQGLGTCRINDWSGDRRWLYERFVAPGHPDDHVLFRAEQPSGQP